MSVKVSVDITDKIKTAQAKKAVKSDELWKYVATQWHRHYAKYVPMQSGVLYQQVTYDAERGSGIVNHNANYAHYQYTGNVYTPNIPITEGGAIVGYFSLKNRPKTKTERKLKYSKQFHPNASAKWDEAAAPVELPKLEREIESYLNNGGLEL